MAVCESHQEQLTASAISPAVQAERGYRSVAGLDEWQALGRRPINTSFAHVGLAFPVYRLGGKQPYTWVLRPDNPRRIRGRTLKYEWPNEF